MTAILLIEDTRELAQVIQRELENEGYRVCLAADGPSGLAAHTQQQPNLVILDWMLPGMDGLEVLRRIRQSANTPILMLTARNEEIDRVIGLEVGADDYLTKPFGMRELLARVHALLRRAEQIHTQLSSDRQQSQTILAVDDLSLEPEAHLARKNGALLDLTRTEFELLHLLLRNPGRTFSRTYLLNAIWGQDFISGDRSVDNAILRLRRKLGATGDQIETVWGVGYRYHPHE